MDRVCRIDLLCRGSQNSVPKEKRGFVISFGRIPVMIIVRIRSARKGNVPRYDRTHARMDVHFMQLAQDAEGPQRVGARMAMKNRDQKKSQRGPKASDHPFERMNVQEMNGQRRISLMMNAVDFSIQEFHFVHGAMPSINPRVFDHENEQYVQRHGPPWRIQHELGFDLPERQPRSGIHHGNVEENERQLAMKGGYGLRDVLQT